MNAPRRPDDERAFAFAEGELLLVDKPLGWTSFDVVNKVRYALRANTGRKLKVGHAGTLDPLATGLLLLATGKATKTLADLQGLDKTYTGVLRLGAVTASHDAEEPAEPGADPAGIDAATVRGAAAGLTGTLPQVPPAFSAVKVDGQRAYRLARRGRAVEPEPRPVTVHRFDTGVPEPDGPAAEGADWQALRCPFTVHCGKGTYIRSLARDLGQALGCGAYLAELRRTAIGLHRIEDAWALDALVAELRDPPPA